MSDTRLRAEIERQEKYLESLPGEFEFPLFNAMTALESQRRSGYRTTAAAAREIVDNAIEAGASRIHVVFDAAREGKRRSVTAIAFIDDGSGMVPKMIQAGLSWGGGTHFQEHDFIGKFGFGLPNASINQTKRVEVYSRADASEPFFMSYLDVNEFTEYGIQKIPPAQPADLPQFVKEYLERTEVTLSHGTVVVWVKPDRLSYRSTAVLGDHLRDDFGAVYRYLLQAREGSSNPLELVVQGVPLQPVDPLFLDPAGRFYVPPAAEGSGPTEGGARKVFDRLIAVKYYIDPESGERHLGRVEDGESLDASDPNLLAVGTIGVKVARFPVGFVVAKKHADNPDARARWEIRKSRRGMSFVRADREIETVDAFPRSARDKASGMGDWPLLQGYAYHWGVEVKFHPMLDEVFGITNDKQSVRPIEDFWRVLQHEEIDRVLRAENTWQSQRRKELAKAQAVTSEPGKPSAAELAAQAADTATGRKPRAHGKRQEKAAEDLEKEAADRAKKLGIGIEEAKEAIRKEADTHRYRIEYFDNEYAPFFEPEYRVGGVFVVRINRKHVFYDSLYSEVLGTPAQSAIDLLLIALARAEMIVDDEQMATWYPTQRSEVWSPFLSNALKVLAQTQQAVEEELDLSEDAETEEEPVPAAAG